MHHCECKDVSLQRGRFCTRSLASYIPRSSEDRSSWMFLIQVVRGYPGGRLQFSGGGSKVAWLASAFSSIRARCPKKVRRRDLMMDESGCWFVVQRISAFLTVTCVTTLISTDWCSPFSVSHLRCLLWSFIPRCLLSRQRTVTALLWSSLLQFLALSRLMWLSIFSLNLLW